MSRRKLEPFDRYRHYVKAVQSPDVDVVFFKRVYRQIRKREPIELREDFCGTFAICCEWVKQNEKHRAYGVDLDLNPVRWGVEHHLGQLSEGQGQRVFPVVASVLDRDLPHVDVIVAVNFSYFIFKKQEMLDAYFENCKRTLKKSGILILDCFGGSETQLPNQEETNLRGFKYFWEQKNYNPVTAEAKFHIHFKRKGEKKREKVFSYDWRLWTIPELRQSLQRVGFQHTAVYWEGTAKNGSGNHIFRRT